MEKLFVKWALGPVLNDTKYSITATEGKNMQEFISLTPGNIAVSLEV